MLVEVRVFFCYTDDMPRSCHFGPFQVIPCIQSENEKAFQYMDTQPHTISSCDLVNVLVKYPDNKVAQEKKQAIESKIGFNISNGTILFKVS